MEPNEPTSITLDILKKIHEGMGELQRKIDDGLASVQQEVAGLRDEVRENSRRLDAVDRRIEAHSRRIGAVETRMHDLVQVTTLSIARQLDLGQRVDAVEQRVAALEAR